jgi:micrococcal nuclease
MGYYRHRRKITWVSLLLTILIIVITESGWLNKFGQDVQQANPGLYTIDHYDDGDTIAVNMNGSVETVRFIGVDTPETHKPNTPVQCFGPQAAAHTKEVVSKFGRVRLVADHLDTNRDRYGRLLRYVYLPDGTLLDEQLIKQGYGFAYLSFPFTKKLQFAAAQQSAQKAKLGLWASCHPILNEFGGYTSNVL